MFSALACGQPDMQILDGPGNHLNHRNVSFHHEEQMDGEFFDKLLSEGIRLKKKCKSLKTLVCELEETRENDKIQYEYNLQSYNKKLEATVSDLKSIHFLEVAAISDSKVQEIESLHKSIKEKGDDISKKDESLTFLTTRNEFLEAELMAKGKEYQESVSMLEDHYETEKKTILMQRMEHEDGVRITLLRRALLAEDELVKLKSNFADVFASSNNSNNNSSVEGGSNMLLQQLQSDVEKLTANIQQKDETIKELTTAAAMSNPSVYSPPIARCGDRTGRKEGWTSNSSSSGGGSKNIIASDACCELCPGLANKLKHTENMLEVFRQELFTKQEQISRIMNSKDAVVSAVNELLEENQHLKDMVADINSGGGVSVSAAAKMLPCRHNNPSSSPAPSPMPTPTSTPAPTPAPTNGDHGGGGGGGGGIRKQSKINQNFQQARRGDE